MTAIVQSVSVPFEYPVIFTENALDAANDSLVRALGWRQPPRRQRVLAFLDRGVIEAMPDIEERLHAYAIAHAYGMELVGNPLAVRGGEAAKNDPGVVDLVHRAIDRHRLDRHSIVVVVGGGAVLDAVGYAAATAHRGVRLVRLPTTVLSQADSGVGVKNGINAFGKKNFVGTFAPPFAVVVDGGFLATLPPRDLRAGMSEAVKVALVRDAAFFRWIGEHRRDLAAECLPAVRELCKRSAAIHAGHIATSGDPFEQGSARPLDFGHWSAHKLEMVSGHRLRHGEAVAIGIALDTTYSVRAGLCGAEVATAVLELLGDLGLPTWDDALAARDGDGRLRVLDGLDEFREHLGGDLTITLLGGIGRGVEVHAVDSALVAAAVADLAERR